MIEFHAKTSAYFRSSKQTFIFFLINIFHTFFFQTKIPSKLFAYIDKTNSKHVLFSQYIGLFPPAK